MKHVLITGTSGFIGSYLVQHLKGFNIQTLSLQKSNWQQHDFNADVIIHCAGIAHASKSIPDSVYHEVNCELTKALLQKAIESNVSQFIFLSTALVFGEGHVGEIQLNSPLNPQNVYAKSKVCAEEALQLTDHISTTILRIPLVIGENPKGNVRSLAKLAKFSPIFIKCNNKRSVLYLDDLANIIEEAVNSNKQGTFHPYSENLSTSQLYQQLRGSSTFLIPLPINIQRFLRQRSRIMSKLLGDFYFVEF
jgi:UDP-glucose 4-epimerase